MSVEINGKEPQPEVSPLQAAQDRLVAAAMGQGLPPQSLGTSAYINGLLQSARVTAMLRLFKQQFPDLEVDTLLTDLCVDILNNEITPRLEAQKPPAIATAQGRTVDLIRSASRGRH